MRAIKSISQAASVFTIFATIWLLQLAFTNARIEPKEYEQCSKNFISVVQFPDAKLPSGSRVFSVQILNACPSEDCTIGQIRLRCGSFHSERLINPRIFRRLSKDECLVNDGYPITTGGTVSFEYVAPNQFPLDVSSVSCSN